MDKDKYKEHWENIYSDKKSDEFSWFQEYPKTSLEFILNSNLNKNSKIIDVGGGDSKLVDILIEKGYENIFVLDISSKAIERSKKRLCKNAEKVKWIISDITDFETDIEFDLWHDRATFHFLKENNLIEKYISLTEKNIKKEGLLIIGIFSETGPSKCSGIEIKQYSEKTLSDKFKMFNKIKCIEEKHLTPSKVSQNFIFCSFIKK